MSIPNAMQEGATSGTNCYRDPRSRRITGCFVPDEESGVIDGTANTADARMGYAGQAQ